MFDLCSLAKNKKRRMVCFGNEAQAALLEWLMIRPDGINESVFLGTRGVEDKSGYINNGQTKWLGSSYSLSCDTTHSAYATVSFKSCNKFGIRNS